MGATPVAATNNLNFGNPERPEIMAQLVEAIEGIGEACRYFETPITGGNVSLYNETLGEAIWPTPVMGIVGLMKTAAPVTIPFKNEGRTVMLLGGLGTCDATRFGGTQYAKSGAEQNVGLAAGARYGLRKARAGGDSRDRERGTRGIGARCGRWRPGGGAGGVLRSTASGASIEIATGMRPEFALFHEGPSRILVSTAVPEAVEKIARENNVEAAAYRRYNERAVTDRMTVP